MRKIIHKMLHSPRNPGKFLARTKHYTKQELLQRIESGIPLTLEQEQILQREKQKTERIKYKDFLDRQMNRFLER
jgi:hypothetical protein